MSPMKELYVLAIFELMSSLYNNVSIAFWNIDGLYSRIIDGSRQCKFEFEELSSDLSKHDIILLAETHCSNKDNPCLANFKITHNIRPKHPRAGKHSGGLAVCIKQNIAFHNKFGIYVD